MVGIESSYCLGMDHVCFERDMVGYKSYIYIDATDKAISSLEIFYENIYGVVFNYISSLAPSMPVPPDRRTSEGPLIAGLRLNFSQCSVVGLRISLNLEMLKLD